METSLDRLEKNLSLIAQTNRQVVQTQQMVTEKLDEMPPEMREAAEILIALANKITNWSGTMEAGLGHWTEAFKAFLIAADKSADAAQVVKFMSEKGNYMALGTDENLLYNIMVNSDKEKLYGAVKRLPVEVKERMLEVLK